MTDDELDALRAAAFEADDWFNWALDLADSRGWSRGPVRDGEDPEGWTPEELRTRISAALARIG